MAERYSGRLLYVILSRLFQVLPVTSHDTFGRVYDIRVFVESFDDGTFRPVLAAQLSPSSRACLSDAPRL